MDLDTYSRFALTLLLVLGLIFLLAAALRRFGPRLGAAAGGRTGRRRIGVVEAAMIDNRRRLVLVRRDNREHLLLIGGTDDLVIERGIDPPETPGPAAETAAAATAGAATAAGSARSFRDLLGGSRGGPT